MRKSSKYKIGDRVKAIGNIKGQHDTGTIVGIDREHKHRNKRGWQGRWQVKWDKLESYGDTFWYADVQLKRLV